MCVILAKIVFLVEETVEKHLFEVLSSRQVFSGQVIGLLSLLNVMMRNQRLAIFGGPMTVALCNKSLESFESTIMCLRGSLNQKEVFDSKVMLRSDRGYFAQRIP